MSTPSPAGPISLPKGRLYRVTILNEKHYPPGHPALLGPPTSQHLVQVGLLVNLLLLRPRRPLESDSQTS